MKRWICAVFACLALVGPTAANDIPAAFAPPAERFDYIRREVMIPMRDGVRLHTVIFTPKAGAGPRPIVLTRTPYGIPSTASTPRLAEALNLDDTPGAVDGYIRVFQDSRGRFKSDGAYVVNWPVRGPLNRASTDHVTDAWDTIDWLVKHVPDNNGRVGMTGGSYAGFLTLMALLDPHPALKAAVPANAMVDGWMGDDFYHNGALRQVMLEFVYAMTADRSTTLRLPLDGTNLYEAWLRAGSAEGMARLYGADRLPAWRRLVDNPAYGPYWRGQALQQLLARARPQVPVLSVHGQWDQEDNFGPIAAYGALESTDTANRRNHLVIGPWSHGGHGGDGSKLGALSFGAPTGRDFRREVLQPFWDHHLRGVGAVDPTPAVSAFETGTNRWRRESRWPPRDATPTRLYLRPAGALSFTTPVSGAAFAEFVSDPAAPVPFRTEPMTSIFGPDPSWRTWLVDDQRPFATRPDVATFVTEPLAGAISLAGPVRALLNASTTGSDADWVVKLIDVYPDDHPDPALRSRQLMISADIMRGRYRERLDEARALPPGEVLPFTVRMPDASHVFLPGHRIMVQVQSSWFPLYDRNPQTFTPSIADAPASSYRKATHRLSLSAEAPSYVELSLRAPLTPRAILLAPPERSKAKISPDGRQVAFLAPRDGVPNLWLAPLHDLDAARPLTSAGGAGVREFEWTGDGRRLVFPLDPNGAEAFSLHSLDIRSGALLDLSPRLEGARAVRTELLRVSRARPGWIAVTINDRDPRFPDVWAVEAATGRRRLLARNDNLDWITVSDDLKTVAAIRWGPDGAGRMVRVGRDETRPLVTFAAADARLTRIIGMAADGSEIYYLTSQGRDTAGLFAVDVRSRTPRLLGADDRADVLAVLTDPHSGRPVAFQSEYDAPGWKGLDPAIEGDVDGLAARFGGAWTVLARSRDDRLWTVEGAVGPGLADAWLWDRKAKSLTRLFSSMPALKAAALAETRPVLVPARDGLMLPGHYTAPRRPAGEGAPPLVLLVHGGPWARDRAGFDAERQLLADRGYAVLSVNFRGSTGFGRGFTAAGDLQWGKAMSDDLVDAADWAAAQGLADRDRTAIMGASYGGYATLMALARDPDRFACGVDLYGPVNLHTLLGSLPNWWEAGLARLYASMGDPRTEAGRAILGDASLLQRAGAIKKPLLIVQGANDPKVPRRESEQMAQALRAKGTPFTYLFFPDEGHALRRPANRIAFWSVAEPFLQTCLGGRAEPLDPDAIRRSSIRVPDGAALIPGLEAALRPLP